MVISTPRISLSIIMIGKENYSEAEYSLRSILPLASNISCQLILVLRGFSTSHVSDLQHLAINTFRVVDIVVDSDNGLFDAMNIGLEKSVGDCLFFLNAGDELIDSPSLSKLVESSISDDAVISCATVQFYRNECFLRLPFRFSRMHFLGRQAWFETHNHQGFLCPGHLGRAFKFHVAWGSDSIWMNKVVSAARSLRWYLHPIARFQLGGTSNMPNLASIRLIWSTGQRLKAIKWLLGWLMFKIFGPCFYYKYIYSVNSRLQRLPPGWRSSGW